MIKFSVPRAFHAVSVALISLNALRAAGLPAPTMPLSCSAGLRICNLKRVNYPHDQVFSDFAKDPEWLELRAKYAVPLSIEAYMMSSTDYSNLK